MNNGEYYWIKSKDGGHWEIGVGDENGTLRRCGSRRLSAEEVLSAVTVRDMRDRFAVAALAAHVGDFQVMYATTTRDALAEKCYAIADPMLAARQT